MNTMLKLKIIKFNTINWIQCKINGHDPFDTVSLITYQPTKTVICKRCFKRINNPRLTRPANRR